MTKIKELSYIFFNKLNELNEAPNISKEIKVGHLFSYQRFRSKSVTKRKGMVKENKYSMPVSINFMISTLLTMRSVYGLSITEEINGGKLDFNCPEVKIRRLPFSFGFSKNTNSLVGDCVFKDSSRISQQWLRWWRGQR